MLLSALALVASHLSVATASGQIATFQQQIAGTVAGGGFGRSIDIDGTTAVIGASAEDNVQGAAYVFVNSGGTWTQVQRLVASDGAPSAQFGTDVAISGNTIVIGARNTTVGPGGSLHGAAYVFASSGGTWTEQAKLVASDRSSNANFGWAVAIDGNTIAVGANTTSRPSRTQVGAAYIFERSGSTWVETILSAPDGQANDFFGNSIGLSGSTVCIGSNGDDVGTTSGQGSAYVFARAGAGWALQQQLLAADGQANDSFGGACAIDGDTAVVSAAGDDVGPASNAGSAYVFVRAGSTWTQQRKFSGNAAGASFGVAAIQGNVAVIGATGDVSSRGSAYIFERSGATWTERQKVEPSGGMTFDYFGSGIGLAGTSLLIGAPSSAGPSRPGYVVAYGLALPQTGSPGVPTSFAAAASGNMVGMSWAAPTSGGAPTGYTVVARTTGGQLLATLPVGATTTLTVGAPNGVYVVSVRASNASGDGPESASVTVTVPTTAPVPANPTNLAVTVSGDSATFAWTAPASGGAVTSYLLLAGTSPSFLTPIARLPLPASPTSTTVTAIPAGTYWVRVLAANAGGTSAAASNEVTVTVAGPQVPGAPTLNAATVSGNTVSLSWAQGSGGTPTSYVLRAAASPGGTPIVTVPLGGTSASFAGVPSGTYYVHVTAVNGVGPGPASNAVTIVVP